jgi:hypothetical protein
MLSIIAGLTETVLFASQQATFEPVIVVACYKHAEWLLFVQLNIM